MMHTFFTKLAMLILFLLSVTCGWFAVTTVFSVSLVNILLLIVAAFLLLRAFELADKINKLGPYAEDTEDKDKPSPHDRPRRDEVRGEETEIPNEE